ncbi:protein 5NUC-like isoform X2 [Haemaphysalis longicornis]
MKEIKATRKDVLFLNPGDYFQGTTWFSTLNMSFFAQIIALMEHDAIGIGVHEFDRGPGDLQIYLQEMVKAGVPVLMCNGDVRGEKEIANDATKPSIVLQRGGRRIGIIGYINPETAYRSYPGHTQFLNDKECVRREAQRLHGEGVNIIIALGHSGLEEDKRIATEVPLVDVVVGGFSHYYMYSGSPLAIAAEPIHGPYPVVVQRPDGTQALVVTAFWFGKYMGNLEVVFDHKGNMVSYKGSPVLMDSTVKEERAENTRLAKSLEMARAQADADRNRAVGSTKVLLEGSRQRCRLEECPMGNLLADALFKWYAGLASADDRLWGPVNGAIVPARDIHSSVDERLTNGRVLMQHIIEVLQYHDDVNHAFKVTMQGRILKRLLEHSIREYDIITKNPVTDFLQVSGVTVLELIRWYVNKSSPLKVKLEDRIVITSASHRSALLPVLLGVPGLVLLNSGPRNKF